MAYQLIAVDMDGTLLNSKKEITPRTEAAVTAALARGYHVVMTTGRCYRQIVPYMAQFPAMRYAITSSGAAVADCAQDRIISAQNLPADVAAELVRAFEGLDGFPILFFNGEALYRPRLPDRGRSLRYDLSLPASACLEDDLLRLDRIRMRGGMIHGA